jgi:hypothetical protein
MLYVGLDLSRKRLDWEALREDGEVVARGADPPDADGLRHLTGRLPLPVLAAIESMGGARLSTISSSWRAGMCASPTRSR